MFVFNLMAHHSVHLSNCVYFYHQQQQLLVIAKFVSHTHTHTVLKAILHVHVACVFIMPVYGGVC